MHTGVIHAGRDQVREIGKTHRGHQPAVAVAPDTDTLGIHVGATTEIEGGRADIVQFAAAHGGEMSRLAKFKSIPGAAAVIHGQNEVALCRKIKAIRIVISIAEVPSEQALIGWAAMKMKHRGCARWIRSRR